MSEANATPAASTKKNKKNKSSAAGDAALTNGKLEAPPAATPAQSQREELLAERAENKAAVAAVALLADKTDQPTTPLTAAERILAKRSKALGKKLQRITQYEAQDSKTLNEDQKAVIASKDSVMAAMKELNEVGKAWKQAEKENVAAQQAETQKAVEHEKKSGEATGDVSLTLLQQFLRLFTVLHLPQMQASTFAPTLSSDFTDSITSQEAAAVGKLYQDIVSQPIDSGAETGHSNEGSVKELLSSIEAGEDGKEILESVSFARIKDLVSHFIAPSSSELPSETVPAAAKSGADKGEEAFNHERASAQEAIDVAPELVEAPAAASQGKEETAPDVQPVNGKQGPPKSTVGSGEISFLQSSEVSRAASAAPSVHGDEDETAGKDTAREIEQVTTHSSGDDQITSTGKTEEKPASSAVQISKFDWSADVEGGESDLGDPMQAFPDQDSRSVTLRSSLSTEDKTERFSSNARVGYDAAAASEANGGLAVPSKTASSEAGKASETAEEAKASAAPERTAAREQKGGKPNGAAKSAAAAAAAAAASSSTAPSKKAPIVDEDGFVLQTSKKSLHQQQQQQQQQQASFRGRGRGRGGPRGGGGDRGGRGGGGVNGGGRGRGEFRGGARGGRGGVSGAGANGPPTPTPASTAGQ